jgi:hypothetical protein
MRNLGITLALASVVCALAFGICFSVKHDRELHQAAITNDTRAWLHAEFHLNDGQLAAIAKLQGAYSLRCDQKCAAMMSARRRGASPHELRQLEAQCVEDMRRHFQNVAALMPPGEGERYLASVLPYVAAVEDAGTPSVRLEH